MFFEGSEKKLEIIVAASALNLRELDVSFWSALVNCAHAEILSQISNADCDAYLLSESSLFVWHDRFVMLTCGNSTLVDAACYFIDALGVSAMALVSYQRKNEYQAHLQASSFADDVGKLRQRIAGKAMRVGHLDSHHHYFFCSDSDYRAPKDDQSCELLMYHIRGELADYLNGGSQSKAEICAALELNDLFPDFELDAHLFDPSGFSMNGLWGKYYVTLHITPQSENACASSYVSFETNLDLTQYPQQLLGRLLALFSPVSWDTIGFNINNSTQGFPAHLCLGRGSLTTEQGYDIRFSHYQQLDAEVLIPEFM
ncbi:S-adenosylmethionine decarboxylase proenzyme [Shewanella baltica]|uniref:S-adenosylmethionine decarboxylase proenzyme n=1 Tax=Shewanella baltica TaxID=62322 RepID=UPI00217EB04B|nr:S-adenosylmethionine decarboxylase proenzyme [Shewanella baltica]MCS6192638.1 adenosylmethionine decarboxylase [Shewanella baltica]